MESFGRRAVARGVGWTALQTYLVRAASFATFIVVSRVLSPAEIGTASLAMAVAGFVVVVIDVGVSSYVVRVEELTATMASTAFWVSLVQSVLGAVVLLVAAGPLSTLLGQPDLTPYLRVLSVSAVFYGLSAVPAALLVRRLEFRTLAVREVMAGLVSAATGVGLALAGAGVWALVAQNVTQGLVAVALLWTLQSWRPGLTLDRGSARDLIRFGVPLLGTSIVQALRDRTEQILLGTVAGVAALGYWSVATRLLGVLTEVTLSTLNLVALPLFSRARRTEGALANVYSRASAFSVAVMGPALALLAIVSPGLLPYLFGERWQPSVLPAQLLCAAYAVGSLVYFTRTALLAEGRSGTDFALTLAGFALHLLAVLLVAPYGLAALAAATIVETVLVAVLSCIVLRTRLRMSILVLADATRALAVCSLSAVAMFGTSWLLAATPSLVATALATAVGAATYLALMMLLARPLLLALVSEVRGLLRRDHGGVT